MNSIKCSTSAFVFRLCHVLYLLMVLDLGRLGQGPPLISHVKAAPATYRSNDFRWAQYRPDNSHRECEVHQASIVIFNCLLEYKMF